MEDSTSVYIFNMLLFLKSSVNIYTKAPDLPPPCLINVYLLGDPDIPFIVNDPVILSVLFS